ncbi:MAG: single-stranded DNA-binding protein [Clostridia bacterium]|nr:single-stranded DNA-binding protein [Clostridia bacterium]
MNKVELMGRLTRDPEVSYSSNDSTMAIARFSLAVNRSRSKEQQADFINCVAFGKTGEFVGKYFTKGQMMALSGNIQVNPYTDKDGNKRTSTNVVAEEVFFTGGKSENSGANMPAMDNAASVDGFYQDADVTDDDLPF